MRAVELPAEHTPGTLLMCEEGPERLRSALLSTRQLAVDVTGHRQGLIVRAPVVVKDPEQPTPGPDL